MINYDIMSMLRKILLFFGTALFPKIQRTKVLLGKNLKVNKEITKRKV